MLDHHSELLFITGVARSGTTLVAECLNHHSRMVCFSDPLNELFRGFHHFAYYQVSGRWPHPLYPMDHFFFTGDQKVKRFLEETDFRHTIPASLRERMFKQIADRGGRYCPSLEGTLNKWKSTRFDELLLEILSYLRARAPGKQQVQRVGLKEAWCEHLVLPLSRSFPRMRFIFIVRDPRAVVSSNYNSNSRYPIVFNVRDWRKSVYWFWRLTREESELRDRCFGLRYEDAVESPAERLREVSRFLDMDYEESMVNSKFQDANTSYSGIVNTANISTVFKEQWRDRLPMAVQQAVSFMCYPELKQLRYPEDSASERFAGWKYAAGAAEVPYERLGDWCRQVLPPREWYETIWRWKEAVLEMVRNILFRRKIFLGGLSEAFFESRSYFDWLQQSNTKDEMPSCD